MPRRLRLNLIEICRLASRSRGGDEFERLNVLEGRFFGTEAVSPGPIRIPGALPLRAAEAHFASASQNQTGVST